MRHLATLIIGFSLFIGPAIAQDGGSATFEGVGHLGGYVHESYVYAVSGDGSMAIGTDRVRTPGSGDCTQAFRWEENGEVEVLEGLPCEVSEVDGANGISYDGTVITGQARIEGEWEAYRWEDGEVIFLGDLSGGEHQSAGNAVSSDGKVIVGRGWSEEGPAAWAWSVVSDSMLSLGRLPGGTTFPISMANGVSADGSVVVGHSDSEDSDFSEAFRWENGVMEGLGFLPGGAFAISDAADVTPDGSVVVGSSASSNGNAEAFRWTAESDSMMGLGNLPGGDFRSAAFAVSADGSTIVGRAHTGFTEDGWDIWEAFIWTEEDGMRNLKDVLETDYGLDLTGWTLDEATAISDDGTVIVGNGFSQSELAGPQGWRTVLAAREAPAANVSPTSFAFSMEAGGSAGDTLTIGNSGGSGLNWSIVEAGSESGPCELPGDVAWLSVGPGAGTTAPDESEEVSVVAQVPDMEPGDYVAFLCVTTNDPDTETIEIPVTLTVEGAVTDEATPEELAEGLSVPQPNPVRGTSTFTVAAKRGQQVAVEVFDAMGRRVQTLYDGALAAGMSETLTLDATVLPAGVYVIRATGEGFVKARRITVVR